MSKLPEIVVVPEDREYLPAPPETREEGVDIPLDRLNPDTLHNLISEYVTREWEELGDSSYSLETKVQQVLEQLTDGKAKIVFDLTTNSCNIVVKP